MKTPEQYHAWMRRALEVAEDALPDDVPVGALLLNDQGELVASSPNRREREHDPTAHAEMRVLQQAGQKLGNWRLTGCTLVVTLEPCPMCAAAIAQARVSTVIYGADDAWAGACGSRYDLLQPSEAVQVTGGVLAEECRAQLEAFFKSRRGAVASQHT